MGRHACTYGKILPWKGRTHVYTHAYCGVSGLCITSYLIFVSRFQSLWLLSHTGCVRAALRSFSLWKGVTMARGEKTRRERELCYSFFTLRHCRRRNLVRDFFLQATWKFTGVPGDYERLIARKRHDFPTLSFPSTFWMQANTLLLTLCTRRAIVAVRLLNLPLLSLKVSLNIRGKVILKNFWKLLIIFFFTSNITS